MQAACSRAMLALVLLLAAALSPLPSGGVHVRMPASMKGHSKLMPVKPIPLILVSTALGGSMPISAYSETTAKLAQHGVVWATGAAPPSIEEMARVAGALNVKFVPVISIGHSSGAVIARHTHAHRVLLIDPVDGPVIDLERDGTHSKRIALAMLYPFVANDTVHDEFERAHDASAVVLTGDGVRMTPEARDVMVTVKDSMFEDLFDSGIRKVLGSVPDASGAEPHTGSDFRDWIVALVQALIADAIMKEHDLEEME
jgi:hypothetical protein